MVPIGVASIITLPKFGCSSPFKILIRVVLPEPFGSEQPDYLAPADLEIHIVQRLLPRKDLGQMFTFTKFPISYVIIPFVSSFLPLCAIRGVRCFCSAHSICSACSISIVCMTHIVSTICAAPSLADTVLALRAHCARAAAPIRAATSANAPCREYPKDAISCRKVSTCFSASSRRICSISDKSVVTVRPAVRLVIRSPRFPTRHRALHSIAIDSRVTCQLPVPRRKRAPGAYSPVMMPRLISSFQLRINRSAVVQIPIHVLTPLFVFHSCASWYAASPCDFADLLTCLLCQLSFIHCAGELPAPARSSSRCATQLFILLHAACLFPFCFVYCP